MGEIYTRNGAATSRPALRYYLHPMKLTVPSVSLETNLTFVIQ